MQGKYKMKQKHLTHLNKQNGSAVQILYEIVEAYHARGVKVYFVRLKGQPMNLFRKSGLLDVVGESNLYRKLPDAIESIEREITLVQ